MPPEDGAAADTDEQEPQQQQDNDRRNDGRNENRNYVRAQFLQKFRLLAVAPGEPRELNILTTNARAGAQRFAKSKLIWA